MEYYLSVWNDTLCADVQYGITNLTLEAVRFENSSDLYELQKSYTSFNTK